ncbi:uncharacterized protein METZ01_LOCUS495166, partial [marine metagenome]
MPVVLESDMAFSRQVFQCGPELVAGSIGILVAGCPFIQIGIYHFLAINAYGYLGAFAGDYEAVPLPHRFCRVCAGGKRVIKRPVIVLAEFFLSGGIHYLNLESALNSILRVGAKKDATVATRR